MAHYTIKVQRSETKEMVYTTGREGAVVLLAGLEFRVQMTEVHDLSLLQRSGQRSETLN